MLFRSQISALTVIRMHQLIEGLQGDDQAARNSFARYVAAKEDHAEAVKREARIIWGDYFKPEHLEKHPDLHNAINEAFRIAERQLLDLKGQQEGRTKDVHHDAASFLAFS